MEYLRLTWDDIVRQCGEIAKRVKEKGIKFDIIIGIARGGWPPARLLSDLLDCDELYNMRVKFYSTLGETTEKPLILHATQFDVTGKDILLVDDIADTGGSLITAVGHLKERKAGNITVATLVKKPGSKFEPHIYIDKTDKWVVFPWEVHETIREIGKSRTGEDFVAECEKAGIKKEELELHNEMMQSSGQ
jgi:hypoxanthine phosphoribosyltransferase